MHVSQKKAAEELCVSERTLQRYRKDEILRLDRDWFYAGPHRKPLKYDIDRCKMSIKQAAKKDYRTLEV